MVEFDADWLKPGVDSGFVRVEVGEYVDLAVSCMDLTSLAGDDASARIEALCDRAVDAGVAAVCDYPAFVSLCLERLSGSGVRVATVAGGFPLGLSPLESRLDEVRRCRELGAQEIDVAIRREWALTGERH